MRENITKDYRKASMDSVNRINIGVANIARNLEIDDRVEALALKRSFLTVKDHKADWPARVSCRLINPTKSNIGNKSILDRVNNSRISKLEINQ